MGLAHGLHWFGVFLLFASSILLLVTTIGAPVFNDIGLLEVALNNGTVVGPSTLSFGTFGYCILNVPPDNTDQDFCSGVHVGYDPAYLTARATHSSFDDIASGTSDGLTRVMVLHPIACGIAFIAFVLAAGHHMLGSLAGALVAAVAWILTLVALAVDFTLFGIIHHHVNEYTSASASYGIAIWTLVAAFVTLFFGMVIVFFTCCAAHREKKRGYPKKSHA